MAECIHEVYEPRLEQVNIGTWFPDTRLISVPCSFQSSSFQPTLNLLLDPQQVRYITTMLFRTRASTESRGVVKTSLQ
jgi:hypothetical protein